MNSFSLNKENISRTLWHLAVVGGCAAILAILNALDGLNLDPKTLAVLAVISPVVKVIIEGFRKG